MDLASKIGAAASNPAMLNAYARWVGSKLFTGRPPRLPLQTDVSLGEWLSFSEYWSFREILPQPERLLLERVFDSGACPAGPAIDIGANIGAFTCAIAALGRMVHAFEPIPETFCRLKSNVKHNGLLDRTQLNCLAVGREQGLVTFAVQEHAPATNRMTGPGDVPMGDLSSTQVVAAVSLDEYCAEQGIDSIPFLKIDVEGMEPYVLQGARNLFLNKKVNVVLIEICPVNLRSVGLSPAELFSEFQCIHYSPFFLNEDGTPGAKMTLDEMEATTLANAVLLPDA